LELRLLRSEESIVEIEFAGATHTYLNLLRQYLKEHESVQFAAYRVTVHTNPVFYVRTLGGKDPTKTIREANNRMIKTCNNLERIVEEQAEIFN